MAVVTTHRPLAPRRPARSAATVRARRRGCALGVAALLVVVALVWALSRSGDDGGAEESTGPVTQNGWPAIDDSSDPRLVSFPWVTGQVLGGDVYTVLAYFAQRFDAEVEPIDPGSSWGWAYRPVVGQDDVLSNHASGTAIDLNAPVHPLGSTGTLTADQMTRLRALIDELSPALAWGGDFDRPDEMHVEIVGTPDEVAEVAARLGG